MSCFVTQLAESFHRSTSPQLEELTLPVELRGSLPAWLSGSYFRNGPGKLDAEGTPYAHPFDGDGMLVRIDFEAGRVRYQNRYVRTRELEEERALGRMLYRGFGTNLPGGLRRNLFRTRFKNAANTSVVLHGGRLLALWEGGLPHALDPRTLTTLGRFDFEGSLQNDAGLFDRLLAPELPFSAHPKLDPRDGVLHNFGTAYGRKNRLYVYEIDREGRMQSKRAIELERMSFVHDFVLTERHRVFFLVPVSFDVARAVVGLRSPAASLRAEKGPTEILVVDRHTGEAQKLDAPACFAFHHANGYDDGAAIVIDSCRSDSMPSAGDAERAIRGEPVELSPARLTRFRVGLGEGRVTETRLFEHPVELPTIHPGAVSRRHRYVYALAARPEHTEPFLPGLGRFDVERGEATLLDLGEDLPAEPLFVPRPGSRDEAEGVVLSLVYRAREHATDLLVLDAHRLEERARVRMPHHVPPGFHGCFVPSAGAATTPLSWS